ncbi:MAG: hypothetical protein PHX62_05080, partial [Bacilli bacterium]|nr:hypothetical protein [Bacilli bacterium]
MRKFEFIKPQTTVEYKEGDNFGRITISPLERGYGITIGNIILAFLIILFCQFPLHAPRKRVSHIYAPNNVILAFL